MKTMMKNATIAMRMAFDHGLLYISAVSSVRLLQKFFGGYLCIAPRDLTSMWAQMHGSVPCR